MSNPNTVHWELARSVVGLVADMRESAYRQGYTRGFDDGHESHDSRNLPKIPEKQVD